MQCLIITGISGAGKSQAIKYIEDLGYFCVDNMLPDLISSFITLCHSNRRDIEKVAFVVDSRSGDQFDVLLREMEQTDLMDVDVKLIFLEASDEVIIRRYKETRRKHPLAPNSRVSDGLVQERKLLEKVKKRADIVIDTSLMKSQQLRNTLYDILDDADKSKEISVNILSFGYKYGIPIDADIVFDVRFLPNPFYIDNLRDFTGLDKTVSEYVLKHEQTQMFLNKLTDMVEFLLPHYKAEGKQQLVIAIGCTGGKHRSVAIAEELFQFLKKNEVPVTVVHRDYQLDNQGKR
ncbi:MAG: RNase adapter RapZ [Ruminococcaceae bacterium]|nr:RNase adapter RapZ [Oscillospiraceae bacterium]